MNTDFVITEITRVIMVGKEEYPERKTSFFHSLRSNELIFHISGSIRVLFNGEVLDCEPGSVRFLPKGPTEQYDVLRRENGECIDVFFQTDRPVSDRAFVLDAARNEVLAPLFRKIFARWVGKEEGYRFECTSLLYKIFGELQRSNYVPPSHQRKIAPGVEALLNGFLQEDFTVPRLAALCNMSESYFKKLFKEIYGVPPKKYIIQLKINHACDLLRLERYTVTKIAELCNFSDVYFFSRQFKEYMGITPTQFVEKYRSSK